MMRLHLVHVGKTAFPEIDQGVQRYLDRLRHYTATEVHLIKAEKVTEREKDEQVRNREGERILRLVGKQDVLIALDQRGKQMGSEEWAAYLDGLAQSGASRVWLVIGGPVGLSAGILERADRILALSKMTFPHDLTRLILAEQLYRAYTILKGEPYHR